MKMNQTDSCMLRYHWYYRFICGYVHSYNNVHGSAIIDQVIIVFLLQIYAVKLMVLYFSFH